MDFLERHQLDPSPANYNFAIYYVTMPASALAREVDAMAYDGIRLSSAVVLGLIERHALPDTGAFADHRERTMERQAEELGTLTSEARDLTEALGRDVGSMALQTDAWPGASDLAARLSEAERELAELRDEFQRLRDEIASSAERPAGEDHDAATQAQDDALRDLEPRVENSRTFVMLMFSIDGLLVINRRFGRSVGDNVLSAFEATLRDIFPKSEPVRYAGNEFIIATPDLAATGARLHAEEALAALEARRLKLRGTGEWIGTVTASAGIAVGQGEPLKAVLGRARASMADAAAQGGNRVEG
ncbi:GGDEF domain-containing protein [Sphingomonas nostoxanthinifaciens]|uniref:GGDEF domain-containing protein n=1 Tax=Sphingomonas nostoxanthinifaciens TaxID=2872652 RepID=UPI001CC1C513|nr:diguanylate cyclase [Sphingomonas nostoxanthinifaciens]UAK24704.1 diguanylate cyclase [Sphingomonas nostoxanthinifaciens]